MKHQLLILATLLMAGALPAQVDTSLMIEGVTVMANRIEQDPAETGRSITVIKRSELLDAGVRSLDEAFQYLGGVEVQMRGINGVQADISIRGSTFNQVMVLIDGQPVNDPLTGHFSGNIPVNLLDVEQIEVLRGPSAAIYGPDAVGGVINIVTRTDDTSKKGLVFRGAYEFGAYGLSEYDLAGEIGIGDIRVGVSYNDSEADGPGHPGDTTNRFFDVSTLSGFVNYSHGNFSTNWRISNDSREFDARYYYTRSPFDRSIEKVDRLWLQGMVSYSFDPVHSLHLNVSRIDTDDEFLFTPNSAANQHNTIRNDLRLEWKSRWSDEFTSMLGVTGNWQSIESNDRGDHEEGRGGLFAMVEYRPVPGLTITPALRLDQAEAYDLEINPQLAARYGRDEWIIRGMVGRSIRAADFTERFVNFGRMDTLVTGRNLGNPGLAPERSWTAEIGGDYAISPEIRFSATLFGRKSKDLIDYIITPTEDIEDSRLLDPNGEYFYTTNIGELTNWGVESRIDLTRELGDHTDLRAFISHTFVRTDGAEGEVSKYLSNHAEHLLTWQAAVSYRMFELNLNGVYKKRNPDLAGDIDAQLREDYHLTNGQISASLLGDFLSIYGRVNNIFDTMYSDILGAELPGRWWSAGVRMNWK